jgi:hypothetical protein
MDFSRLCPTLIKGIEKDLSRLGVERGFGLESCD